MFLSTHGIISTSDFVLYRYTFIIVSVKTCTDLIKRLWLYNILLRILQLSDILDEGFLETMEKSDGEATLPLPGDGEATLPLPADEARIMKSQYSYFLVIKSPKQWCLGDLLFLLRFLLLLFSFSSFSFLSADHELVHGRSQELQDRISWNLVEL